MTYVALLYSIILGPGRRLEMAPLREMAADLGYERARTLVATGNLVFEAAQQPLADMENALESAFERRFGRAVAIIVRDAEAWRRLAAANPFEAESRLYPDRVGVRVMRSPITAQAANSLRPFIGEGEAMEVVDGDPWFVFGREPGKSKLLSAIGRKPIGVGTARNWNTVRRLAEMLDG